MIGARLMPARYAAIDAQMRIILSEYLGLSPDRVRQMTPNTLLFGALPELDSFAATNLLGEIEAQFGVRVDPQDLDQPILETFGNLCRYISDKTI